MEKANTVVSFVGMDVHKESIDVTVAEEAPSGEVRHVGTIGGDLEAVAKLVRKLRRKNGELRFVYEAGSLRLRDLPLPARAESRLQPGEPVADSTPSRRPDQDGPS